MSTPVSLSKDVYSLILKNLSSKEQTKLRIVCKIFKNVIDENLKDHAYKLCGLDEMEKAQNLKSIGKYSALHFHMRSVDTKLFYKYDFSFVKSFYIMSCNLGMIEGLSLKQFINLEDFRYMPRMELGDWDMKTSFKITDFPLSLKSLSCSLYVDIQEIEKLLNLEHLYINFLNIYLPNVILPSVPLIPSTFLKNLKNLKSFHMRRIRVVENTVKNNIESFELENSVIESLDFLKNNKNITRLNLTRVEIRDKNFSLYMENLKTLKELQLISVLIDDYDFLMNLENLEFLNLGHNKWVNNDLSDKIKDYKKLRMLFLSETNIKHIFLSPSIVETLTSLMISKKTTHSSLSKTTSVTKC